MRGNELFVRMVNQGGNTILIKKQMKKAVSKHPEAFFTFECDANEIVNKITPQLNST